MKRILFFGLLISILACSESAEQEAFNPNEFPQKWELVKMTGQVANMPPMTGEDMLWQEYYVLYADSSFNKIRIQNDEQMEADGIWKVIVTQEGPYLRFEYPTASSLIGNCTTETIEILYYQGDNTLSGTWQHCDGPGLYYERRAINFK